MSAFLNVDEDGDSPRVAELYFTASPPAHPDPGTQQLIRPATSPEPAKPKLVLIAPARRRGTPPPRDGRRRQQQRRGAERE